MDRRRRSEWWTSLNDVFVGAMDKLRDEQKTSAGEVVRAREAAEDAEQREAAERMRAAARAAALAWLDCDDSELAARFTAAAASGSQLSYDSDTVRVVAHVPVLSVERRVRFSIGGTGDGVRQAYLARGLNTLGHVRCGRLNVQVLDDAPDTIRAAVQAVDAAVREREHYRRKSAAADRIVVAARAYVLSSSPDAAAEECLSGLPGDVVRAITDLARSSLHDDIRKAVATGRFEHHDHECPCGCHPGVWELEVVVPGTSSTCNDTLALAGLRISRDDALETLADDVHFEQRHERYGVWCMAAVLFFDHPPSHPEPTCPSPPDLVSGTDSDDGF